MVQLVNLKAWSSRIATFVVVAVLSILLLMEFPFYPLYLTIILALVLGALALEFPYLGLILAVLLSGFGAMYQNAYIGLTYLIVLVLFVSLGQSWIELALMATSWILAFSYLPPLAIIPTVLAGLHLGRKDAVKIGALSSITVFLLAWARGITKAGLMLVPFPATGYLAKPIPDPWVFGAFLPDIALFNSPALGDYFAPLASSIGDFRFYAVIAAWSIAGYLTGILAGKWKKLYSVPPAVIGTVPILAVSVAFAGTSFPELGMAVVGVVVATFAYKVVQSLISVPGLGAFTRLEDLVPNGIPQKYSLLLGSPVCDERNLLVHQFLQSGIKSNAPSFLLTSDMDFARSSMAKFEDKLTVLVANPRADTISGKNVVPVATGIQNLTTLNIELVKAVRNVASQGGRVCLDVLSDILLTHKMLTTRKWVTDLVPRLDEWGFTVLGILNPILHTNEDARALMDLFKGYLEISEKDFSGKMRKVIAARKMTDLQFNDSELLVDAQVLRQRESKGGLRGRLSR